MIKKKIEIIWRNFWGSRYWIYENEILTKEILIYHRRIYVKDIKGQRKRLKNKSKM